MKKLTLNLEKTWALLVGFLIVVTPVLADSPIDNMIVGLRNIGFPLVLLWLLTLAVVYGILSHLKLPESMTTRGVISIVVSFLVLIACAGTQIATFLSTLSSYAIAIAVGLIIIMMFFGITGIKTGEDGIFTKYPKFFAGALIAIAILIFISAGGLSFFAIPEILISSPVLTICFFLFVMVASVWMLVKENGES